MIKTTLPHGNYVAVLTPMNASLQPDLALMAKHCKSMLDQGVQGIALLGTTGEANSFSLSERQHIISGLLEAGVPAQKIMVGTGCCAYTDTITLTRHALDAGIKSILMLPPFYYKQIDDTGLFNYFEKVVQEVADDDLEIYLYHFPKITGIDFKISLLEQWFATLSGCYFAKIQH